MTNISTFSYISAGSANQDSQTACPTTGARLMGYEVFNTGVTQLFLKFYNKKSPTSADTPFRRIGVPGGTAGAGATRFIGGITCENGIGIRMTANLADNDTTAVSAGALVCNIDFQ